MPPLSAAPEIDLALALERIGDGFIVFDREWRYRYVNRAAERFADRPRAELLGRVLWEVFPELVGTDTERVYRSAASGTNPVELELRSVLRKRWVAHRLFPSESGLSVAFQDVTDRKEAEEARRESEERFRSVFEHSLAATMLTAPTGEILAANPAACRLLRRTEEEICRLGRAGVVDVADPRLGVYLEERRQQGFARGEFRMMRKGGTTFEAEVSSVVFTDRHGEQRTSMTVFDLTERKRAERTTRLLAEAGERLPASLDVDQTMLQLAELVVPRLADLCFVDLREGQTLRRVAVSPHPGLPAAALRPPHLNGAPAEAGVAAVLQSGKVELVAEVSDEWLEKVARDAEELEAARALKPTSLVLVPLRARGAVIGVLSLVLVGHTRRFEAADVPLAEALGDRAALALENARLYQSALEARRLRDEVLAMVSHDLRNPLNAITLNASLLAARGDSAPLERIRTAAARADRLIEDLLTVAVLESGTLPLVRGPEAVAPMVDEVVQIHRPLAEERRVSLVARVEPGCPVVEVDRHRLVQALSNLVGNAVKFTPAGGAVELRVAPVEEGLALSVTDTGPGIEPEALEHVFDRFWQGKHARRAGAGLGLAIAKGCVEAHGGRIAVESAPGHGSTFTITVPLGVRASS